METDGESASVVALAGSIQEPETDGGAVQVIEPSDKTKFRLTLEPIMMLLLLGVNVSMMVQTNLIEERVCLHSDLGKNKSVNCYNMTAAEQEIVQPAVADLQMIKNLIETLVPCVTALFLGPWSDLNGRLPLFLAAISGMVVSNCMYCVFSTMPSLPPIMFLLCSIPVAVSGGGGALFIASFCYIVDITDFKTRAFRLGVLQTFISFGSIIGSLLSPLLYSKSPTYAFALSSMFTIAGLLYTSLFLKETVVIKKGTNTKLFNLDLVKSMWETVMKRRFGFLRCIIILSAVVLTFNLAIVLGEDSLMYMYLQKQFSWTLENYTLFNAYATLLSASIPAIGLYVLSTKLEIPDMYLATAATGLRIIEKVGLAYSQYTWQFYFVKIFGCVVLTSEPLVRSQLSKSFPPEDLGKIYAFISVIEGFGTLLGSPIYTTAYNMTIHNFANFIFLLSSIFGTFVLGLYIMILFLLSRSTKTEDLLIIN
ncbi:probable peptidoglycan muropeptide transporter SLC46 [Metopolophium dirhodum]|uniref:probable peptidoglycan muropeptide transporter SLC46 n=1 Tax=Metopolophium dirhodum TaxID=44670 RepID=UPI00298F5EE8|nr:probable peptidoglycan muropeptide transporter SLC46 [Metopolophium dirhodum]